MLRAAISKLAGSRGSPKMRPRGKGATRASLKVLVVARWPVVRAGMRAMLEGSDIRVVGEAETADQVLRALKRRSADQVLVASEVDDAESLEFVRRVKENRPTTAIIMLTTRDSARLSQALALGCSGFLPMSIGKEALLGAVRAVARGECVVEPTLLQRLLKDVASQRVEVKPGPTERLTRQEEEVLRLIVEGQTNRQIAQRLGYGVGTVKGYVQRIIEKLEVSDRTQAAVKAVRLRILS